MLSLTLYPHLDREEVIWENIVKEDCEFFPFDNLSIFNRFTTEKLDYIFSLPNTDRTSRFNTFLRRVFSAGVDPVLYLYRIVSGINTTPYFLIDPASSVSSYYYVRSYSDFCFGDCRNIFSNHTTKNISSTYTYTMNTLDGKFINRGTTIVFKSNTNLMKLPCILCIKRKYIPYFYQCMILGIEVDPRIFYLLVDKEFDCKDSYAPRFRPSFRKFILKSAKEQGMNIVYDTDLFNKIFKGYTIPGRTITDKNLKKKEIINQLINI